MTSKKLVFLAHASKRREERGIPEEWVAEVVYHPDETIDVSWGRKASFKRFEGSCVVVIYEEKADKAVVVTVIQVDRERLKRYGFSRI